MKQYITLEQYQELNKDNRVKWAKVVVKHLNRHLHNSDITLKDVDYVDIHQSTTIGQMIEFLESYHEPDYISTDEICYKIIGDKFFIDWIGELCDSLWEEVKKVLESK